MRCTYGHAVQLLICCNRADQREHEFERVGGDELRREALTKLCAEGDGDGIELARHFDPESPADLDLVTCRALERRQTGTATH